MLNNQKIIEDFCKAGEGKHFDGKKIVSAFTDDGYMRDMASGTEFRGQQIVESMAGLASAFPDVRREVSKIHLSGDVVIVELSIRGTHTGVLKLASGAVAPTGKPIDVPSCDIFYIEKGKIKAFHCYNEAIVMQKQLGIGQN